MTDNLVLTDKQVAMNEVLAACDAAANRCTAGADILREESDAAALLRRAGKQHSEAADVLRQLIRSDHLPQDADTEKEWLTSLGVQLRAMMSTERKTQMLEACLQSETDLLEKIQNLFVFPSEPQLKTCLTEMREKAGRTMEALRQERPAQ